MKLKKQTMRELIIDFLFLGPRTNAEMEMVGGKGWRCRCHEINSSIDWAKVVTKNKVTYLSRLGRVDGK